MTRKLLRLFHFIEPLTDALEHESPLETSEKGTLKMKHWLILLQYINTHLGVVNDISDDLVCLGKMQVIDESWIKRATPWSDRLWFCSIWMDMTENLYTTSKLIQKRNGASDDKDIKTLEAKIHLQRVSFLKLAADLVFCSVDVFELGDRVSPGWQNISGWIAALLGTYKLIKKHS
jgi:hypothetical protein